MSEVEYAIKWGVDGSLELCLNAERAQELIDRYPQWDGRIVRRVVEYGEWERAAS